MKHENISSAIAAIIGETKEVQQTGKVSTGRISYPYASDFDIVKAVRKSMSKHGVVCVLNRVEELSTEKEWRGRFTFHYHHAGGPDFLESQVITAGRSTDEKGCLKAITAAKKYSHLITFTIASSLDPEEDENKASRIETKEPERVRLPSARERAGTDFSLTPTEKLSTRDWSDLFGKKGVPKNDFTLFREKFFEGRPLSSLTAQDFRKLQETPSKKVVELWNGWRKR